MSLTQPFMNGIINTVANSGETFPFYVLGGDKITSVTYTIYNATMNEIVYENKVSFPAIRGGKEIVDNGGDNIREFNVITMPSPTGLTTNSAYTILLQTSNGIETSVNSSPTLILTYATPTITFKYKNNSGAFVDLTSSTKIEKSNTTFQVNAISTSILTEAQLNYGEIIVYGVKNGVKNILAQSGTLYDVPLEFSVDDLTPTVGTNSAYDSYTVEATIWTIGGMKVSSMVEGITCDYTMASGDGTLYATNLSDKGYIVIYSNIETTSEVAYYELQITNAGEENWITLQKIDKVGTAPFKFTMRYNYCANETLYDIRMVPYTSTDSAGTPIVAQVYSQFCSSYIVDMDTLYPLFNEWGIDNSTTNQITSFYTPYGRRYPIIGKNSVQNYRQDTYTALLLSDTTLYGNSSNIDRRAEVMLRKEFNEWLTNGEAKIIKTNNGDIILVFVVDSIGNNYYKELGNGIASTQFNWIEIGGINEKDMYNCGMLNNFMLVSLGNESDTQSNN